MKIINYFKSKHFFRQLFKYSIVGIFNTIIGLSIIYFLFNIFNLNYIFSNVIGYACGLVNSFIWNKRWTFNSKKHYSKELFPFFIVFLLAYFANLIIVITLVESLKINPNIAQLFGVGAYTSVNFIINRAWTFSPSNGYYK
jgi:putative flippase GtrA